MTPREVAGYLRAGKFFWLDLEDPGDDELAAFFQSLQLPAATTESVEKATERSSFTLVGDSVRAVLPAAVDAKPAKPKAWLEGNYVTLLVTEQFLLTVHVAPIAPLQHARHRYKALDEGARADSARVLVLILDALLGSFQSQLLALDDRLGEIQLGMLRGASPEVQSELIQVLGILTDAIQELARYSYDLAEIAEKAEEVPVLRSGERQLLDRHQQKVTRMGENAKEIRNEVRDALKQYSEFVAGRQSKFIRTLTIVATVFLPLSFFTGYFGMNFRVLVNDVQNTLWAFILLGLLLPVASAAVSVLLIYRLEQLLGVRQRSKA